MADEVPVARRVVASAFANEAFAFGMFGDAPIDRFVGMMGEYADWPSSPSTSIIVAARHNGHLLAVAHATLPGSCFLCDDWVDDIDPRVARSAAMEREFRLICRESHLAQQLPPHAHIESVATEPFIAGRGVGAGLMQSVLQALSDSGVQCAVLECLTARERFYERCGFHAIDRFPDPGGADLTSLLMRADLGVPVS
jgi:GNAT superfamily N-acetyltransferase